MAKLLFILAAIMALQICIEAAPNTENHAPRSEENPEIPEAEPKLDNEAELPEGLSEATKVNDNDDRSSQVQRQKRFYNYFNFGGPYNPYPFDGSFNPDINKRDDSQDTGVYGTEYSLSQIYKRLQDILGFTRHQSQYSPVARFPVVSYIPVLYITRGGCGCTDDMGPSNDGNPTTDSTSAPPLITSPPTTTAQPISPATGPVSVGPLTTEISKPSGGFPDRLQDDDDDDDQDGARPISFVPIKPKKPLKRPAPPVDHGTIEGGNGNVIKEIAVASSTPPPAFDSVVPESSLPVNPPPSRCDGAVLTCCHRPEPTYECFLAQGCPDPISPDNPCDFNLILDVVRKFEYYYANRQG